MYAAVVSQFDQPPRYEEMTVPVPGDHEELVEVLAAGLHPRVRSQASGSHYTSTDELPLVPGVDGVGRTSDGTLVYFVLPDTTMGSMAEQTVIDVRRSVALPADTDVDLVAAAMNPGMSSWVALRRRIDFRPGQSVLVLGATGNAGRLAVQIAHHLGAATVIGAGRDTAKLADLGADETISFDDGDFAAAADVDVVIDYLWSAPAEQAMTALLTRRADPSKALHWIQIGAITGPTMTLPSALLRGANIRILGSGQGSVAARDLVGELPPLAAEISAGTFVIDAEPVPLADVAAAWAGQSTSTRTVIKP
jgi:NADPH:quinone reductase-like Zn-dependent oxidoreductase